MKAAIAAALLLLSALAHAQVTIDRAALDAAIDRELKGVLRDGDIEVLVNADDTATVSYFRRDGVVLRRTVTLPPREEEAIETLALLAGNLVRDQAGDLTQGLTPPPAPAPTPPPPEPAGYPTAFFGFGFVPPLSTDLIYGPVVYNLGIHMVAGYSLGTNGLSLAGAVDIQRKVASGVMLAGAVSLVLRNLDRGVQAAGAVSIALGDARGAQLAGGANIAGKLEGAQIAGGLNYASELNGLQLAPINIAGRARGVQIGVINYADAHDGVPIGIVSIVRNGITELDTWVDGTGALAVALRHGTRRFYNLYAAASGVPDNSGFQMFGLGIGTRFGGEVELDLSAMCWDVEGLDIESRLSLLNQARFTAAFPLGRFALFAGAGVNVLVIDSDQDGHQLHPFLDKTWKSGSVTTRLWPAFFAGFRIR